MRVLYLSDNSSGHNRRLLEKLSSFGHQVWFLDITKDKLPEHFLPRGVHWVQPARRFRQDADPSLFKEFLPELRYWLKELDPDLVHAGPVQTCAYVAALSNFHPLVVMSWGSDLLLHADRDAECRRATETALLGADGLFCDCDTVRAAAQRFVVFPDSRIALFPYGIERDSFTPWGPLPPRERLALEPETICFICTRSWEPLYDMD